MNKRPTLIAHFRKIACVTTFIMSAVVLFGCGKTEAPAQDGASAQELLERSAKFNNFNDTLKAAEAGNIDAQIKVGQMYEDGYVADQSYQTAIDWYKKAAATGNADALYHLALVYETDNSGVKNDKLALEYGTSAAKKGSANANVWLYFKYANGRGVPRDPEKSISYLKKAAELKDPSAIYLLGAAYMTGDGVPQDHQMALSLYKQAAALDEPNAQYYMGAAYDQGEAGLVVDKKAAAFWFRLSAEQGNPKAQTMLGRAYMLGEGVQKDDLKAKEWLTKAAISGNGNAQMKLSALYLKGEGVPRDLVSAYAWANIAAAAGEEKADSLRSLAERGMTSNEIAEAQSLSRKWSRGNDLDRTSSLPATPRDSSNKSSTTSKQGTGTGFFINSSGQLITNNHVVSNCKELRLEGSSSQVRIISSDPNTDLAVIQSNSNPKSFAKLIDNPSKTKQGEDVVVFGFPLNSLLSSGGNLTPGVVSALSGITNNTNQIQITAPIQPGSSGSPVLNRKGQIVGVVAMKLSDSKMAQATGSIGQTVNFAVSGQTLKSFLEANNIKYTNGGFGFFSKSNTDLADEARKWTTVVECWN